MQSGTNTRTFLAPIGIGSISANATTSVPWVEIVFSAFKRMFGEHLYSLKWKNMIQEVNLKVAAYNKLIDMGAGAM